MNGCKFAGCSCLIVARWITGRKINTWDREQVNLNIESKYRIICYKPCLFHAGNGKAILVVLRRVFTNYLIFLREIVRTQHVCNREKKIAVSELRQVKKNIPKFIVISLLFNEFSSLIFSGWHWFLGILGSVDLKNPNRFRNCLHVCSRDI